MRPERWYVRPRLPDTHRLYHVAAKATVGLGTTTLCGQRLIVSGYLWVDDVGDRYILEGGHAVCEACLGTLPTEPLPAQPPAPDSPWERALARSRSTS